MIDERRMRTLWRVTVIAGIVLTILVAVAVAIDFGAFVIACPVMSCRH